MEAVKIRCQQSPRIGWALDLKVAEDIATSPPSSQIAMLQEPCGEVLRGEVGTVDHLVGATTTVARGDGHAVTYHNIMLPKLLRRDSVAFHQPFAYRREACGVEQPRDLLWVA